MKTLITTIFLTLTFSAFAALSPTQQEKLERTTIAINEEITNLIPQAYDEVLELNVFDIVVKKERSYYLYSGNQMVIAHIIINPIENPFLCGPIDFSIEVEGPYDAFVGSGKFVYPIFGIGGETTGLGFQTSDGKLIEIALTINESLHDLNGKMTDIAGHFITMKGVETERQVLVIDTFGYWWE